MRVRWVGLIAVLSLGVGIAGGMLFVPPVVPSSAKAEASVRTVPAVKREFTDARTVAASPELSPQVTVPVSGPGGVVSWSGCVPGESMATGQSLFAVEGIRRIAIVSDVPLWRDLGPGDEGDDVAGLQRALSATGRSVAVNGEYGSETRNAVSSLQEASGFRVTGRIALDAAQWVPANLGAVASCGLTVGNGTSTGAPAFTAGGDFVALTLTPSTVLAPDMAYTATLDNGTTAPVTDRKITDSTFLAAVARTAAYVQWQKDPAQGITLKVQLATPIPVVGVPPSAVVLATGKAGCVVSDGGATVAVTVVSSELGTVYITADEVLDRVLIPAAKLIGSCG